MRRVLLLMVMALAGGQAHAMDRAEVVARFNGCDYFIADGPRGLYVLEWYGGYDPEEGDQLVGDIASYGFKDVFYLSAQREGRVWVEDYLESRTGAMREIENHCR